MFDLPLSRGDHPRRWLRLVLLAPLCNAALPLLAAGPAVETLVITATRGALAALDAPASISVVSEDEIRARGADTLLDAIRGETGLTLQGRAVGGRKVLGLRGLDSRHTLILVDGRRVNASDGVIGASDFGYDWVAADDIQRIEIVRGPLSVLYGSEALGGVVHIITREAGDRWRLGARLEAQRAEGSRGGDGERATLRADGPLTPHGAVAGGTLLVRAGASGSRLSPLASPADPRLSELEGRDKDEGWLGLAWRGSGHERIDLEHREGREERLADARERGGKRRYHQTLNRVERSSTSLAWEAEWPAGGQRPAALAPLSTALRAYRSSIGVVNTRTEGVTANPPQRLEDRVLEGQLRWPMAAHTLTAGFEWRDESLADPGLPGGESSAARRALFVQDEWLLTRHLTLTSGVRHDRHALFGSQWSPRAYLVWRLAPQWAIKGGMSHGFVAPNLKQIVPGTRAEGPNLFNGNPALRPETSDGAEAGLAYAAGALQARATLFVQRVRDLIDVRLVAPGAAPGTGTYSYENLARAKLAGLEFAGSLPLAGGWTLAGSYTHLDATNGDGQRLERRPRHSSTLHLNWSGSAWRAGLRIEHSGPQMLPSTTVGAPAQRAPEVTLAHAFVARQLPAGLELSAGVSNLGNLRLADESPLFTQAEAPRTWRLTLRGQW